MIKKLVFTALIALSAFCLKGQTIDDPSTNDFTNSPYSRYGYGILADKGIGASRGMGGIAYGVRGRSVNPYNPASYSGVDSLTFVFDIGISYSNARLSQPGASQDESNGGLDYVVIQFPLAKKLGFSAGFLPYSNVGYSFGSYQSSGNQTVQKYYTGAGSLDQIYAGLSYEVVKGLSVGANASYLYGTIMQTRGIPLIVQDGSQNTSAYTRTIYTRLRANAAKYDIGVQYQMPVFRNKTLTLGATYTPRITAKSHVRELDMLSNGDTLSLKTENGNMMLPHTLGFGFTLSDKKLIYGADFTFQKWENMPYPALLNDGLSTANRFNNYWRVNAGAEYSISPISRNFVKRMKFRGGVNYSNSYLNAAESATNAVNGYNKYGATLGLGLPFRDPYTGRVSYINISFEYSKVDPRNKSMIKEEYLGVSLSVNFNDLWFMKSKFK